MQNERQQPNESWNYWAYTLEGAFFITSSAFWEPGTIIPSFLSGLTTSQVLIGLGPALKSAGWMMPQLLVAGLLDQNSKLKPVVVGAAVLARGAFVLLPLLVLSQLPPATKVWAFLLLYTLFCFAEGVTAVPWTEMLGRAIAPRRRGRLLGNMQSVAGISALAAGVVVRMLLGSERLVYPANYAALFAAGAVLLVGSGAMMYAVREPAVGEPSVAVAAAAAVAPAGDQPSIRRRPQLLASLRRVPYLVRNNPLFGNLLLARVVAAAPSLALPFYVLYGRDALGLSPVWIGNSVTAQMLGAVVGGLIWARVSVRWGYQPLIRASCIAGLLIPVWTLLSSVAARSLVLASLAPYLFLMTYVTIGLYFTSVWVGFTNYLLEIVPSGERPMYIGILSTVAGPLAFLAAPGGLLVAGAGYLFTFALSAAGSVVALWLAWRLPPEASASAAKPAASAAAASSDLT